MRESSRPLYLSRVLTVGIGATAGALLVYLLLLSRSVGAFSLTEFLTGEVGEKPITVALLSSTYSDSSLTADGGNPQALLSRWKKILEGAGVSSRVITDRDLEDSLPRHPLLLLATAHVLSDQQITQVKRFLDSGGGVVATWATGTRFPNGDWRGWDFLREIAGVEITRTVTTRESPSLFVSLRAASPLARGLPVGYRLESFSFSDQLLARAAAADAFWAYEHVPLRPEESALPFAAITRHRYGKGRVVWIGFPADSLRDGSEDLMVFTTVVQNALRWAARRPVATVSPWPHGLPAAMAVTVDVEESFERVEGVAQLLSQEKSTGTFFLLTELAKKQEHLVRTLAEVGEVALHGDDHTVFAGQEKELQRTRLQRGRTLLETLSRGGVTGFHPPEEKYDAATVEALEQAGFAYLLANPKNRSSPHLLATPSGRSLILLPRPYYDDYEAAVLLKLSPAATVAALTADLERALYEGGVYILSLHTTSPWGMAAPEKLEVARTLLRRAAARRMWIATADQIATWWQGRENLAVRAERASKKRVILAVTNTGPLPLAAVEITLYLPTLPTSLTFGSEILYRFPHGKMTPTSTSPPLRSTVIPQDEAVTVALYNLAPAESRTFHVDLDSP